MDLWSSGRGTGNPSQRKGKVDGEGGDWSGEDAEVGEEEADLEGEADKAGWGKQGRERRGKQRDFFI